MTFVKICGLQPGDDTAFTVHPSVVFAGIVFAKKSRRYVSPDKAGVITRAIDGHCRSMGVFVDSDLDEMISIGQQVGLSGIQLHGQESVKTCRILKERGFLVWKAISMPKEAGAQEKAAETIAAKLELYAPFVDALLLDAPAPTAQLQQGVTGGLGRKFDWRELPLLLEQKVLQSGFPPVWIAGGVTAQNLKDLCRYWRPYGIDVSSSVEENGRKSAAKIDKLIEAVENLD